MRFQCLNPGCGGTDFVAAKDANPVIGYEQVLGAWREVVRGKVIVCLRCECSMVKTKDAAYLTRRALRQLAPTQARPEPEANGTNRVAQQFPIDLEP